MVMKGLLVIGLILVIVGIVVAYMSNNIADMLCKDPDCKLEYGIPVLLGGVVSMGIGVLLSTISIFL